MTTESNGESRRQEALRKIIRSNFGAAGALLPVEDIDKITPVVLSRHWVEFDELGLLARRLLALVSQGFTAVVREALYAHWQSLSPAATEVALKYPYILSALKYSHNDPDEVFVTMLESIAIAFPATDGD